MSATHRILAVIGTRPEAIKMAPVVEALRAHAPGVETRVAFTGQHTTLVDRVLGAFALRADYDLAIMRADQTLYDVVHEALDGLRDVVRDFRPDVILVQGDTATVFVASLVGFFERVRVGHVVADWHFSPTRNARDLLLAENTPLHGIHVTGNTVVDALTAVAATERPFTNATLGALAEDPERTLVLLTAHRRESFGPGLREVFGAVRALADEHQGVEIVYPVHPNPNVTGPARELLSGHARIHLTEPLDYFDLVGALARASLVLTDSGGIQEEAPTFGVPVLVMREVTERPEGIEAGVAELVGTDAERILAGARAALGPRDRSAPPRNPYGDGRAGVRIADILVSDLTGSPRTTEDWDG